MKKLVLAFLFISLGLSAVVSAHAGAEYRIGPHLVSMRQIPLAPLAGEKVTFYIEVHDEGQAPVVGEAFNLRVVRPGAGRGQVLADLTLKTSSHGQVSFDHRFDQEGVYAVQI